MREAGNTMTRGGINPDRAAGIARENALRLAIQAAPIGEAPDAILNAAKRYAAFILGASTVAAPHSVETDQAA